MGVTERSPRSNLNHYEVVGAGGGSAYLGNKGRAALKAFNEAVRESAKGHGACAGKDVTLWCNGLQSREYIAKEQPPRQERNDD